ncbi:(2Fe-2S)-binding protein, partial [Candidatus Albibeggiatoa sp. nov. NOAA]|uniref:(2Fe-2S)-binding protein n=1 Tax=Candidatus Albibeggiatoa sp. nov. NOAA TaxID=3162724 RepID=UPI0032F704B5|nr:hypothetical protein [Thiotrichaceae bacterium]
QGVTDKQIHNAVCNGACSMRELRECLGVVKQCGKCGRSTHETFKEAMNIHSMASSGENACATCPS